MPGPGLAVVNFFATLAQTLAGFGAPLISMPFMVLWLGAKTATPLSTLVGLLTSIFVLYYYRQHFNLRAILTLLVPAVLGVPLGVYLLEVVDERIIRTILSILVLGYAAYAFFAPKLPELMHRFWGYGFGFFAGILGGAFNSSGPIVAIYGGFRHWTPEEFRSNLQGFFLVTNSAILVFHAGQGNLRGDFWRAVPWAIGGMLLAIASGLFLERWINKQRFKQLVLLMLVISGIRLLF
ncbi:MAG: sulfite exporter TauE/SafE family protein [Chloroflexi bacterium]|nr:MAG: sulfite exporter TauE/SafE family protein [Chloroflexota bacterium]MBL1196281.1 sulfite exporter TauE/SafE family protein [Chloroflexota bacterium]NOH13576.1 sulfite exporter TauE/SafE family protein [Chloroflexota bacterium]